jgi:hypothetical protein
VAPDEHDVGVRLDDQFLDRFAGMLARVDAAGDAEAAGAALRDLRTRPRLVVRLDERARAVTWVTLYPKPTWTNRNPAPRAELRPANDVYERVGARLDRPGGPIAVVVASFARDGRLRERAVRAMATGFRPEYLPFLALRVDDWVAPVRDAARAVLAQRLGTADALIAALPMARHLARRDRGGWTMNLIVERVREGFDIFEPDLLANRDAEARRLGFQVAREQGRIDYPAMVRWSADRDALIRATAAESACDEAVRRGDAETLRSLARSRSAGVRITALVGLVKLGHQEDVSRALDDVSALVRAYARSRTTDAPAHYRRTVTTAPSPGSIFGLGETGVYADAALLTPLLTSPDAHLRAAAVHALAELDCTPVSDVLPLLRDPAPAVVREAASALRTRRTPPELPWQLLADPRPSVRRAGCRLAGGRPYAEQLRAALILAGDDDPALARSGRSRARQLLPDHARPPIPLTARPELISLAARLGEAGGALAASIEAAPPE